jgi:hypothetical protein
LSAGNHGAAGVADAAVGEAVGGAQHHARRHVHRHTGAWVSCSTGPKVLRGEGVSCSTRDPCLLQQKGPLSLAAQGTLVSCSTRDPCLLQHKGPLSLAAQGTLVSCSTRDPCLLQHKRPLSLGVLRMGLLYGRRCYALWRRCRFTGVGWGRGSSRLTRACMQASLL